MIPKRYSSSELLVLGHKGWPLWARDLNSAARLDNAVQERSGHFRPALRLHCSPHSLPPNDWRISCRPSGPRRHNCSFLSALTEAAAPTEARASPACRLHARVRRHPMWSRLSLSAPADRSSGAVTSAYQAVRIESASSKCPRLMIALRRAAPRAGRIRPGPEAPFPGARCSREPVAGRVDAGPSDTVPR